MIADPNDFVSARNAERRSIISAASIIVAPLIAAAVLAAMVMQDSARRLDKIETDSILIATADIANSIVTELQRERGRSSGFISSGGTAFGAELSDQRDATDRVTDTALSALAALDVARADAAGLSKRVSLSQAINDATDMIARLPQTRTRVDGLQITRDEMMTFYSDIVGALLTVTDLATMAGSASLSERLGVLDALLQESVEFAGRERAAGSSVFATDADAFDLLTTMTRLGAKQDTLTNRFARLAPSELTDRLVQILSGDAARERDRLRAAAGDLSQRATVSPDDWFATTTELIDQLMAFSSSLRSTQRSEIVTATAALEARHHLAIFLAIGALLVSTLLALWQVHNFLRPIRKLAISLRQLANGAQDIDVDGTHRRDLVGLLGRSVAKLVALGVERFRDVLHHAPLPTWITRLDGSQQSLNPAMAKFLNLDPAQMSDHALTDFMSEIDRFKAQRDHDVFAAGGSATSQYETMFYRPDGSTVWGHLTRTFVQGTGADPGFVINQILDITEAKRIETAKTNFVSTVSHELRTPLTSISSAVGMLVGQARKDGDAMQQRLLGIADANCRRLLTLINDLLDVDRLTQGGVTLSMERHELGQIANRAAEDLESYLKELDVTVEICTDGAKFYARTDADRVTQVLVNFLSNAAKFSPAGSSIALRIEQSDTEMIRVSVRDSGPGIPDSFADQVFGRFKQADGSISRAHGGSGIGLHISHGLIEQLGGEIGFFNNDTGGATFWFTIPSMGERSAPNTEHGESDAIGSDLPRILHVEDDTAFSELLSEVLKDRARITLASSYAAAETHLSGSDWDLIVLDWELPDGTGEDLLGNPEIASTSVPVIGLSAKADIVRPARAELSILKSKMSLEEIGDIILRVINRREETRAEVGLRKSA